MSFCMRSSATPGCAREGRHLRAGPVVGRWLTVLIGGIAILVAGRAASAETIIVAGSDALLASIANLADAFRKSRPDTQFRFVYELGSDGSVRAVGAGAVHVAVALRALGDEKRALGLGERELGTTPIALVGPADVTLESMTIEQVAAVWRGEVKAWPDGRPIHSVLRNRSAAINAVVREAGPVLGDGLEAAMRRPGTDIEFSDRAMARQLEFAPGALGTMALAQITSEQRSVHVIALADVRPTLDAAAAGTYPLIATVHLVLSPRSPGAARQFVAFATSEAARPLLLQNGVLPRFAGRGE